MGLHRFGYYIDGTTEIVMDISVICVQKLTMWISSKLTQCLVCYCRIKYPSDYRQFNVYWEHYVFTEYNAHIFFALCLVEYIYLWLYSIKHRKIYWGLLGFFPPTVGISVSFFFPRFFQNLKYDKDRIYSNQSFLGSSFVNLLKLLGCWHGIMWCES